MISGLFGLGFVVYFLSALVSYDEKLSFTNKIAWGIVIGIVSNVLWMILAYVSENDNERFYHALLWDSIIVFTFAFTPLLFTDIIFTPRMALGVALTLIGLALVR